MDAETVNRIRQLNQQFSFAVIQMHEAIARKAGLSGTDHKYLGFLMQKGQMTAGELSNLSGLTTGAVTGLIDRFEKKKLVKRQFAAEDRRKVFIEPLPENIMALLSPLFKDFRNKTEKLITELSEREITIIENYLLKTLEIMNKTILQLNSPAAQKS